MQSATARAASEGMPESLRESDDAYGGVIARLNSRWRVIACKDAFQWILQWKASTERARRIEWKGIRYFRTSDALKRACESSAAEIDPVALAILHQLQRAKP